MWSAVREEIFDCLKLWLIKQCGGMSMPITAYRKRNMITADVDHVVHSTIIRKQQPTFVF